MASGGLLDGLVAPLLISNPGGLREINNLIRIEWRQYLYYKHDPLPSETSIRHLRVLVHVDEHDSQIHCVMKHFQREEAPPPIAPSPTRASPEDLPDTVPQQASYERDRVISVSSGRALVPQKLYDVLTEIRARLELRSPEATQVVRKVPLLLHVDFCTVKDISCWKMIDSLSRAWK